MSSIMETRWEEKKPVPASGSLTPCTDKINKCNKMLSKVYGKSNLGRKGLFGLSVWGYVGKAVMAPGVGAAGHIPSTVRKQAEEFLCSVRFLLFIPLIDGTPRFMPRQGINHHTRQRNSFRDSVLFFQCGSEVTWGQFGSFGLAVSALSAEPPCPAKVPRSWALMKSVWSSPVIWQRSWPGSLWSRSFEEFAFSVPRN